MDMKNMELCLALVGKSPKIKLHMKVCNNPPKGFQVKNPKVKSMTLKEALQHSNNRNKKVYEQYVSNVSILRKEQWQSCSSAERGAASANCIN